MSIDQLENGHPLLEVGELMAGFPPSAQTAVTLANWQDAPYQRWSFQHLREVIPTHPIRAGGAHWPLLDSTRGRPPLDDVPVSRLDGSSATVEQVLADTYTDALVVLHDGLVVEERYWGAMTESTRHLVMSVSKSVVGCVAGLLVSQGVLDPEAPLTAYVPEVEASGYGGATVRQVLDMRTGVAFRETYTLPEAEVRMMERSMGWRPIQPGDPVGSYAFLATLGSSGAHGGDFVYRSSDTDMLGWVCERASGTRMADLVSTLLWQPMGAEYDAEITCDSVGSAIHDGGISMTARDLARFGQMLLDDGQVGGAAVVPASWLADAAEPPPAVVKAFASSDNSAVLPGGWYRNQFWFIPGRSGDVMLCLGIHGQMVHVDRATRTVVVKMSSWPDAQNTGFLIDTLRSFGAVGAHLAKGGPARPAPTRGSVAPPRG